MATRSLCHNRHQKQIVVVGKVGLLKNRSELKLVGGNLIVACLGRYAQAMALNLEIEHESLHSLGNRTEVVVFKLLVLGAFMSHEGAAGHHQVGAGAIERLVYKEIFLFPAKVRHHMLHLGVEVAGDGGGGNIDTVEGSQKRCLVVERLTGI